MENIIYTKLSDKIVALLQRQVKHELENSNLYRHISNWCEYRNLQNLKDFFLKQSNDEIGHYNKFNQYLLDKKIMSSMPQLSGFSDQYKDIYEVLMISLTRETGTTLMIKQIADTAMNEKDHQTYELSLQMLKEQVEEETTFLNLLDKWELVRNDISAEFLFDNHLKV